MGTGIRIPLAPAGDKMIKQPIQLKKAANVGTGNPVVARLQFQMFDLVDALGLSKDDRDGVLKHTFVGSQWFVRAEENKSEYARLSRKFISNVKEGSGVRAQGAALVVLEPLHLGDYYQLFLIDLTIGLRLFFKATGLILTNLPTGWKGLKTTIEQNFGATHPIRLLWVKHGTWLKTIYADRGDVEHDPYMFTGFQVGIDGKGNHLLYRPVDEDSHQPLEEVMETYFQDGFVFAEELFVLAIESRLPAGKKLVEIPEAQRDRKAPIRFRVQ
jgi:hypothetical protein